MELVIVTAWRRPEFLWASLTRIFSAIDRKDIRVLVSMDKDPFAEVEWVARQFAAYASEGQLDIRVRSDKHRQYRGNSYNAIESYRDALAMGADLVHLVEDDILVGYDYFDFHRRAHDLVPDAFAVSACRNQNFQIGTDPEPDDEAVYRHGSYQSLGISFRPEVLSAALEGVGHDYYANMVNWCRDRYPDSAIPAGHAEQDGLLNRFREHAGMSTVYGGLPRAYHAGFRGQNRKGARLPGTSVIDKGKMLLAMSADELNANAHSYKDHTTIDLDKERDSVRYVVEWP